MRLSAPVLRLLADAALLLLLLLLGAACCAPTPAVTEREVAIDNRTGESLSLVPVQRDDFGEARALGAARTLRLALPPGRYALQLGASDHRLALPLPAAELGFVPAARTTMTVWPWPPPTPGFAWIPAGMALRGDELGVGQEDERPLATPTTAGFWLATCETTNSEYARFLTAIGRDHFDPSWIDLGGPQCHVDFDAASGMFTTAAPDLPVVKVTVAGAEAYCRWLTASTGLVHRLPSETEWEKAARGPGSRVYAYGDTCLARSANQASGHLRPVASFAPNGFGLCDMTGNAFEWTADAYRGDAYSDSEATPVTAPPSAEFRVLRGGSFVLDGIFVRNAMRMRLRPDVMADDVGFRVLRENADPTLGPVSASPRGGS